MSKGHRSQFRGLHCPNLEHLELKINNVIMGYNLLNKVKIYEYILM